MANFDCITVSGQWKFLSSQFIYIIRQMILLYRDVNLVLIQFLATICSDIIAFSCNELNFSGRFSNQTQFNKCAAILKLLIELNNKKRQGKTNVEYWLCCRFAVIVDCCAVIQTAKLYGRNKTIDMYTVNQQQKKQYVFVYTSTGKLLSSQ